MWKKEEDYDLTESELNELLSYKSSLKRIYNSVGLIGQHNYEKVKDPELEEQFTTAVKYVKKNLLKI